MAQRHDMAELERAWTGIAGRLRAYFVCRAGPTDADDLLQDCFLRAMGSWNGFAGRGRCEGWLWRIAVRTAADAYRRRPRGTAPWPDGFDPPAPPADADALAADAGRDGPGATADAAWAAVERLDPPQREVMALRFAAGLAYDEIADALDVPVGTVRSRLHRAIAAVRDRVQR